MHVKNKQLWDSFHRYHKSCWTAAVLAFSFLAATGVLLSFRCKSWTPRNVNVAFVGNSFQYVNDLPRFLEALSGGKIQQDSCLHGALNLETISLKGNGMYKTWKTESAFIEEYGVYDYGACTVVQLMLGSDSNLTLGNQNGYYKVDGRNPCFRNEDYYSYRQSNSSRRKWDFLVLNDQSARPAFPVKRKISAKALQNRYLPLLLETGATPILMMTYGYWRDDVNMSSLVDVPTFTKRLYKGYQLYWIVLKESLPPSQTPRIAPVGLVFLVLWEENRSMWSRLFFVDKYHPSPLGTYLIGRSTRNCDAQSVNEAAKRTSF